MTCKTVDSASVQTIEKIIEQSYLDSNFWGDMFAITFDLGLRNAEARELRINQIDMRKGLLTLTECKSSRSARTKWVNQQIRDKWLVEGKLWLMQNVRSDALYFVNDIETLRAIAKHNNIEADYQERYEMFANSVRSEIEQEYTSKNHRVLSIHHTDRVHDIITRRVDKYSAFKNFGGLLFPRCELGRPSGPGYEFVSMRGAQKALRRHVNAAKIAHKDVENELQSIRFGLHSFRKGYARIIYDESLDIHLTSVALHHGHGQGAASMTQKYLKGSSQLGSELHTKLSALFESGTKKAPVV